MFKLSELTHGVFDNKTRFVNVAGDVLITSVEHDTRRIQKGALYVAIKGENHDGHDFIKDAEAKGAVACIVTREIKGTTLPQIIVADAVFAYGELAMFWRGKLKYPIIGITGSNGKTTTKDIIYTFLSYKNTVVRTQGNFNNLIGGPYTLLSFPLEADYGIVEMGMNTHGEIARLSEISAPDVALITNVGRAHIGKLGSIDAVFAAKMELFNYMLKNEASAFVINMSDPLISKWSDQTHIVNKVTYYILSDNEDESKITHKYDVNARVLKDTGEEQHFKIILKDGETATGRINLTGRHNLNNVAAGVATAVCFGINLKECISSLSDFVPPSMRSNLVIKNGVKYLIDCYNANPDSMRAAIEAGRQITDVKRHIAVIGDMFELENLSPELHTEIGEFLAQNKYDFVFAIGKYAKNYADGFSKILSPHKISTYGLDQIEMLKKDLKIFVKDGDFVLLKASRGAKLEVVLD